MAMLEKHRIEVYNAFVALVGEEAAQAMMSQFPARDVEEPVTKADLAVGLAELRTEMADLRAELHRELQALGDRLTNRMVTVAGVGLAAITGLLALFT
jgi:hypothetical protein